MSDYYDPDLEEIGRYSYEYTPYQRRKIIRNTVGRLIVNGLSQNKSLEYYQGLGLGISSLDYRQIYNANLKKDPSYFELSILSANDIPSDSMFIPTTSALRARYRLTALITFIEPISGTVQVDLHSVDTNQIYSVDDLESAMKQDWLMCDSCSKGEAVNITLIFGNIAA